MHCNIYFPNSVLIHKIVWIDSGKQRPPTTHCPLQDASRSPSPAAGSGSPATSLESRGVMRRGNTVGAAEAGSRCLLETVNYQRSRSHTGCCTVRPREHSPPGREEGVSVSIYPLMTSRRAEGPRLCPFFMSDRNVPCSPRNNGTFSA